MSATEHATRRHGAALEHAILDAAWEQLADHGWQGFTFEAVAARAHTSKPVLYRRWPTRSDLLVATLRRRLEIRPLSVPDTGSLRGDTTELLRQGNEKRADMFALFGNANLYSDDLHLTPAQLRESALNGARPVMGAVLQHARVRGELHVDGLPERVASLPFALLRAEVLMTQHPVSQEVIDSIVDDVFLPLVGAYEHAQGSPRSSA